LAIIAFGNPSAQHDCDRKGSDAIVLVLLLGPVAGLLCLVVGQVAARITGDP
jgi:hypothetical protein